MSKVSLYLREPIQLEGAPPPKPDGLDREAAVEQFRHAYDSQSQITTLASRKKA